MKLRWCRAVTTAVFVVYFNCVLTNLVSYRQRWYSEKILNGTTLTPMYDSLFIDWRHGYDIPLQNAITLRDLVDVCTYLWVLTTLLVWAACSRDGLLLARALTAQILLVTTFSISQLFTIVPDATPNCLAVYRIPTGEDYSWIFWSYPTRACGNMLWSSDITQLVVFTSFATQMISDRRRKIQWIVWFFGECWTLLTMGLIFTARYQYSVDVLSTVVVVKLAMSHPRIDNFAKYVFIKHSNYYARAPAQELPERTI